MTNNIAKIRAALEYAKSCELGLHVKCNEALAALAELENAATVPFIWCYEYLYDGEWINHWCYDQAPNFSRITRNITPLYTTPPPAKPAPQFVAGEVTKEMCWNVFEDCDGCEKNMAETARHWLDRWRKELGPALGLVEIREPGDEQCRAIADEFLCNVATASRGARTGRAMFTAVSKWLKGEL